MADIADKAFQEAINVLRRNTTELGFKASANYYEQIWARDSAITAVAIRHLDDKQLLDAAARSIAVLGRHQSKRGQIPNYIDVRTGHIYWYAVDATLWWMVARVLYNVDSGSLNDAYRWLLGLVVDESMLITSYRGSEWMDASLGREGKVFYNNVLWYAAHKALKMAGVETLVEPHVVRDNVEVLFWPTPTSQKIVVEWGMTVYDFLPNFVKPNRQHYIHFVTYGMVEDSFDSLANMLACFFDVADPDKCRLIIEYVRSRGIDAPYPLRSLDPPIYLPNISWAPSVDLLNLPGNRNVPYHYHNGGIWPFIGGFYVTVLAKLGMRSEAEAALETLARVNVETEWNEWLHGVTARPLGAVYQTWNAATYAMAYTAVKNGAKPWRME